jgi:antirestriction protein ArdC
VPNPIPTQIATPPVRHASYIANWIELLRADDRAFFTAASQAQKAADYLRGLALTESLLETVA